MKNGGLLNSRREGGDVCSVGGGEMASAVESIVVHAGFIPISCFIVQFPSLIIPDDRQLES